jgi:protein-S-isoprenylcysteine O-methyltransferase Ste14
MNEKYYILLGIFLGCLGVRFVYEKLKKAGRISLDNKILFGFIFAAMCVLWVCWFGMGPLDPIKLSLPEIVRWGGFGLFAIGMIIALWGVFLLRGVENIDHLVTSGLFSRMRHPIYTGFILWIIGWSIFHGAVISFFAGLIGIGNVLYWRYLEEVDLETRYGEEYRSYREATWF